MNKPIVQFLGHNMNLIGQRLELDRSGSNRFRKRTGRTDAKKSRGGKEGGGKGGGGQPYIRHGNSYCVGGDDALSRRRIDSLVLELGPVGAAARCLKSGLGRLTRRGLVCPAEGG